MRGALAMALQCPAAFGESVPREWDRKDLRPKT